MAINSDVPSTARPPTQPQDVQKQQPASHLTIKPLPSSLRKDTWLGAEVLLPPQNPLLNPTTLSPADTSTLQQALYDHGVLVIRKQQDIDPLSLEKLAAIWDPDMINVHSAGKDQVRDPSSILSRNNGARLPGAQNVQIIGNGVFEYQGMELDLRHVDSCEFHAEPLSQEARDGGETRFYRWHQDAPLYESLPGKVTLIHALVVPELPDQKIKFDDGEYMSVQAGSTAFISGTRAFELLTPEQQEFALNTTVQYGPKAYDWIRDCKATSDGLGISSVGNERAEDDLPPWTWDKVHAFPMVYKNRNINQDFQPSLQILGCCVYSLVTTDPKTGIVTTISNLAEARRICYEMQKPVVRPEHVYAHRWEEGDLVIFNNYGVWHSITGQLGAEKRLMWQVTMRSGKGPVGAREAGRL